MRTLSLDDARRVIEEHNRATYASCELADWPDGRVLLVGRVAHCGGADKSWLGLLTAADADVLEAAALADGWRRSK